MYERPRTPWQAERIAGEVEVVKAFGLRNKRELWKAQAFLQEVQADQQKDARSRLHRPGTPRGRSHSRSLKEAGNAQRRKEISTPSFP